MKLDLRASTYEGAVQWVAARMSGLIGGLLLMAADMLARWAIAPQELPVSVLTAILAGTYLQWLMHRRGGQASALG